MVEADRKDETRRAASLETTEGAIWSTCDRARIDQVLTNLISNALKYSPEGGEVLVGVQRVDSEVRVSVTDHGIGIPADHRPHIFEPFQRASNARQRQIEGTGLGLHICKQIVEQHGGRMWFESHEGEGSAFFFTLPIPEDSR